MPEMTVDEALRLGLGHHQAGRLREAEAIYRRVLVHLPGHPPALYLLGALAHQAGRNEQALELFDQAVALAPSVPEYHFFRAHACRALGRLEDAAAGYRRALDLKSDFADAANNLGVTLAALGRLEDAAESFATAVRLRPDFAEAHGNLGNALGDLGRLDEAVACQREALRLRPDFPAAHANLAGALLKQGRLEEAAAAARQAVRLRPDYVKAHNQLGVVLLEQRRPADAAAAFREALRLDPCFAEAQSNLGLALRELGRFDEAVACCRQSLRLRPDFAEAHNNLGNALAEAGRVSEATAAYRRALQLKPGSAEAENNLGTCFERQGKLDEAIACYRRALERKPDYLAAHDNLLIALQYHQDADPVALLAEHRRWAVRHAEKLSAAARPPDNDPDPDRRLRVGYVSPDFRQHPIPFFIEPVLAAHDRDRFTIACYVDLVRPDAVTERLRRHADEWHDITGLSDEQVADQIRRDRVEILVDLAVHAPRNRLLVFARKPAPVQVSYLGYANTTGLTAMDYRLTDAHVDPPGLTEAYQPEELLRLPETFCCYRPPAEAPPVNELPALTTGRVTFASLNRLAKLNPAVLDLWARILAAVPGSRLMLQANGLGDPGTQEHLLREFVRRGIGPGRVLMLEWGSFVDYLVNLGRADVGLDTFPFNGHTTSCHCLWMGVPFVTLAGRLPVARVGVSLLSNLGLSDLIAETPDAYLATAVRLAGDLDRLRQLRAGLRERMSASPLLDARTFTRRLEEAYRLMWRHSCGRHPR
jgi:predicted O-linked N-acetylglucosamine transferase (SPINDLY family)